MADGAVAYAQVPRSLHRTETQFIDREDTQEGSGPSDRLAAAGSTKPQRLDARDLGNGLGHLFDAYRTQLIPLGQGGLVLRLGQSFLGKASVP